MGHCVEGNRVVEVINVMFGVNDRNSHLANSWNQNTTTDRRVTLVSNTSSTLQLSILSLVSPPWSLAISHGYCVFSLDLAALLITF